LLQIIEDLGVLRNLLVLELTISNLEPVGIDCDRGSSRRGLVGRHILAVQMSAQIKRIQYTTLVRNNTSRNIKGHDADSVGAEEQKRWEIKLTFLRGQ